MLPHEFTFLPLGNGVQFFHIFVNTLLSVFFYSIQNIGCGVIPHCGLDMHVSNNHCNEHRFMCLLATRTSL